MEPRICDGFVDGSLTMLYATQSLVWLPARSWSNRRLVCRPTLKVFQLRMAVDVVWVMLTLVVPPEGVCTGRLAPCHKLEPGVAPGATCKPPVTKPFGTLGNVPPP